jgi:Ca2+-binding RTX toxin-like protein
MLDYLDGLRTAFSDLESIVFHAHTDTLRAMAAVAEEGTDRTSPNYFQIEFGLDQLDGDAGDDVIIGDDAFLILPTVGQGQFANAANNATFNVASRLELFANYRSTLDSQFIQHVNMDHPASLSEVSDSLLQQVAWDHDYPLTTGNDEISGDTGDDVIVGDFSIYATPIINHETVAALLDAHQETHPENSPAANCALQAATVEEQLACMSDDSDLEFQLRTAIEELNKDIIEYMEYGRHAVDHYRELEATYLHPYYGHRSEGQQLTLAEMGKDILHGDSGADFIIGDSISLYTVTVASDGQAITLAEISDNLSSNRDPKLETRFMHRGTFEHQDRYLLIATEADLLDGGEGNDILFGQYMDDQLTGAEGVDVLYGGSGTNVLSPDASDDPHQVRTVSDDRPKLQNLTALKSGYQASHQRVADTLAVDMSEDRTLTTGQELPFDVKTGSLMVSRETVRWSTYRSRHNAVQPNDVNNDGTISPIDALQVITILNQMLTVESAVTFGGLGYLSDQALDVSNDSVVSPMDALLVINYLNSVTDGEGEGEPGFDFRAPQAFPPQQLLHSESRPSRPVARISPAGTSRHEVRQQLATRACHIQRSSMDDKVKLHRADRFTPAPSDHEFHQGILAELLDDEIFLCHPNLLP